ncbi:hypothetical protein B0H11DRAFT_2248650 [Mycena galericulata]|nr:hypothetical protein B0H11DRAFT_2248650 [Mycena galericulata]
MRSRVHTAPDSISGRKGLIEWIIASPTFPRQRLETSPHSSSYAQETARKIACKHSVADGAMQVEGAALLNLRMTAAPKTQDEARHLTGQILASTVTPADDPTTGINTQLTALLSLARPLTCNALLASVPSLGTLALAPPVIMRLYQVLKVTFDPSPSTPKSRRAVPF